LGGVWSGVPQPTSPPPDRVSTPEVEVRPPNLAGM
jgi:hypothetical protein